MSMSNYLLMQSQLSPTPGYTKYGDPSQRINEIRPPITHNLNRLRIQLQPLIPVPTLPLRILPPEPGILHDAAQQLEQDQVRDHDAVAGVELGRVLAAVDVG